MSDQNDCGPQEPTHEDLWKQLQNAVAVRSSQDQVNWSIFGIFWAANALLLVAIFTSNARYVVSVVSTIGIITSIVWLMLMYRSIGHITIYEDVMKEIENKLLNNHQNFRITLGPNAQSKLGGKQARVVMLGAIRLFLGIWIIGLGIGLCSLLHG
ncbi:MAG: hypothetical protein ACLP5V_08690 [Candidatus Bathyarchaeia archaeon]